ncbi:3-oxoacyl-[acyl-carrier-protein] reductase 3, chloroplastic [Acipenser ruthenus]|uniref:3-oxoacyl-[acyl-carrier-protein] reductase 3, chloroplastic n=1 Tax=Acipenser ruthenus TaxID=7906 RepID=A0A444UVM9_ACIRT|nr:3-oxoacyl-[acyl-carrier-protein] reductase 3, chloroplastic [Acipenser ruthenus]
MEAAKVSDTPLEFVAEYLTKAKEIAEADPNVPEELTNYLQKALSIASGLDSYLEDVTDQESEHLSALYRKTMDHDWNKIYEDGKTRFKLSKQCITGHVEGQVFLENVTHENSLALRKFNLAVQNDPRVEQNGVVRDEVFSGLHGKSILDRLRLDGKAAYVTGGGQGIGRALAHALGEAGAKVAIVDAVLEKAESVAYELKLKGIQSISIAADISKSEDVQRMIDMIVSKWSTIHIACNNAGINSASEDTTLKEWDQTFNINLRGTFMCCQAAGRIMLKQGYGKIINTASMASLIGE